MQAAEVSALESSGRTEAVTDVAAEGQAFAGRVRGVRDCAEANGHQEQRRDCERYGVNTEYELGPSDKHQSGGDRRAGNKPDIRQRPVERCRGWQARSLHEAWQRREAGWLERRRANTGEKGERERQRQTRLRRPGPRMRQRERHRPERHMPAETIDPRRPRRRVPTPRWDDVGEQHEADRPRRIEPLESENEQRDESGTVTQRRLAERNEETSSARLVRNEVKNLPHQLACGA